MKAVEVKNLTKIFKVREKQKGFWNKLKAVFKPVYKDKIAVDNISFSIEEGESVAFIGPNGAGKSTTIKMLTGILYPTSGDISVLMFNPTKERIKLSYNIGSVVGQKEQLWIHLSPMENFKFFGAIFDIPKKETLKRINELADLFQIREYIDKPVKNLSLGQRMKCEIVASLLHKPKMLYFDEPTIGLDPLAKEILRDLIKKINKELGTTIFFTSHDVGDIEEVCKRVIIINDGKIMLDDSMKNLKYKYLNKKIVDIKLKDKVDVEVGEGFRILKSSDLGISFEVDMEKATVASIIELIDESKILDITISSTPLEDIIKEIYKRKY